MIAACTEATPSNDLSENKSKAATKKEFQRVLGGGRDHKGIKM
jgi:hypothetical protein